MNIPIKKHTKVRRPVSRYITYIMLGTYNVPFDLEGNSPLTLVQDIRKLENPLNLKYISEKLLNEIIEPLKQQKGDWKEWHEDMKRSVKEQEEFYEKHKSLLERMRWWK